MKLAKYSNKRYAGVIEVGFKDKIYEQNILTNVLSIIQ